MSMNLTGLAERTRNLRTPRPTPANTAPANRAPELFREVRHPGNDQLLRVDQISARSLQELSHDHQQSLTAALQALPSRNDDLADAHLFQARTFSQAMHRTGAKTGVFSAFIKRTSVKKNQLPNTADLEKQKTFESYRKEMITQSDHDFAAVQALRDQKAYALNTISFAQKTGRDKKLASAHAALQDLQTKLHNRGVLTEPQHGQYFTDLHAEIHRATNIATPKHQIKDITDGPDRKSGIKATGLGPIEQIPGLMTAIDYHQNLSRLQQLGKVEPHEATLLAKLEKGHIAPAFSRSKEETMKVYDANIGPNISNASLAYIEERLGALETIRHNDQDVNRMRNGIQNVRRQRNAQQNALPQDHQGYGTPPSENGGFSYEHIARSDAPSPHGSQHLSQHGDQESLPYHIETPRTQSPFRLDTSRSASPQVNSGTQRPPMSRYTTAQESLPSSGVGSPNVGSPSQTPGRQALSPIPESFVNSSANSSQEDLRGKEGPRREEFVA
jgi:hypothetical protein